MSSHEVLILPDGESTKSLDSLNQIITCLMEKKYSRTCILIALGGGVIGDLTGFAAACYQRGVKVYTNTHDTCWHRSIPRWVVRPQ